MRHLASTIIYIPPPGCNTASNALRRSLLLSPTPATNWQQNVLNIWKISLHITAWRLTTWALQMSSRFSSLQSPADPYNVQTGCIWKKSIYFSPCLILILYIIFCHEIYDRRRKICFLRFYLWTDLQGRHISIILTSMPSMQGKGAFIYYMIRVKTNWLNMEHGPKYT